MSSGVESPKPTSKIQPPPAFLGREGVQVLQPSEWGFQEGVEGGCPPSALPRVGFGMPLSLWVDSCQGRCGGGTTAVWQGAGGRKACIPLVVSALRQH